MIEYLASMYADLVEPTGIPWDGLTAQGHAITDNGYDAAYMDVMLQEGAKFFGVLGSLSQEFRDKYRALRANEAKAAMTQLMALINQTGADVWNAVKQGDWDAATHFPRAVSVDALAAMAASAVNGAYLHYDGVVEAAMLSGKLKPEEAMAHAQSLVQTFQTFTDLNANGHLDQFKQNPPSGPPVAGLAGPELLAGWALVALGVTLVLGICYLVYVFKIAAPIQQKLIEYCDKMSKSGNPEDTRACIASLENMQKNGNADLASFMGTILKPVVLVAAIGAAVYLGFMFLPGMLKGRREAAA